MMTCVGLFLGRFQTVFTHDRNLTTDLIYFRRRSVRPIVSHRSETASDRVVKWGRRMKLTSWVASRLDDRLRSLIAGLFGWVVDMLVPLVLRYYFRCQLALALSVALAFVVKTETPASAARTIRIATFNTAFSDAEGVNGRGQLAASLATNDFQHAKVVAEIIQRVQPDVILLNEFDTDLSKAAYASFQRNYLSVSQNGAAPISFDHVFVAPSNTGLPSGVDLNNDNRVSGGNDAFGFGNYEGEYGMVVLSRFPIAVDDVRTFQKFLWKDMPESALPSDFYSDDAKQVFRLSSKSHWDVPIRVGDQLVHLLAAHPTPPVFDGPEDRNGRRNHDEIRFWADYISPEKSAYIYDDEGIRGGLARRAKFVIVGDYNADPFDGASFESAINQLLHHPMMATSVTPASEGAVEDAKTEGGLNASHNGDPAFDTSDFNPSTVGNLRVDYVLAAKSLDVQEAAVFWPSKSSELGRLTPNFPNAISDHRLVWADIVLPEPRGMVPYLAPALHFLARRRRAAHGPTAP